MPIAKEGKNKNFGYKCHKMPGTAKLVWLHNFMASTFIYMPKSTLTHPEAFDSCRGGKSLTSS